MTQSRIQSLYTGHDSSAAISKHQTTPKHQSVHPHHPIHPGLQNRVFVKLQPKTPALRLRPGECNVHSAPKFVQHRPVYLPFESAVLSLRDFSWTNHGMLIADLLQSPTSSSVVSIKSCYLRQHTALFVQSIETLRSAQNRVQLRGMWQTKGTHLNSTATTLGWQRTCVLS